MQRAQRNKVSSRFVSRSLPPSYDDFSTINDRLSTVVCGLSTVLPFPKTPYLSDYIYHQTTAKMKAFPYPLIVLLALLPFFTSATVTDATRLRLTVSNENKSPVTLQASDWQYHVEPGKTVNIDERIDGVSIPYTITVTVRGKLLDGHPESTELRIFEGGTYTGRKARISKEGTVHLQSLAAEMDWLYYTRDITPETVYPLAAVLIDKDPGSQAVSDILASYICRAKFSPDSIEAQ